MEPIFTCILTLRPYRPFGPPVFTFDIGLTPSSSVGIFDFANFPDPVNGISLNDNLGDITYTGECTGTTIRIFPESIFGGTHYEVTLPNDNGYLVLPCKVVNTASSILVFGSPPLAEQTSSITTTGSTKLYEVKKGPPAVIELKSQVPLTLEEMIKILKEEAN